jgi:hypothetical protein
MHHKNPLFPYIIPKTYQLADVFEDTDIVSEVIDDLQFTEHLRRLSEAKDRCQERGIKFNPIPWRQMKTRGAHVTCNP